MPVAWQMTERLAEIMNEQTAPVDNIHDIAKKLSCSTLRKTDVLRCLRALGYRHDLPFLAQTLRTSALLSPQFEQLARHFPEAKPVISDFLLSKSILAKLETSTDCKLSSPSKLGHQCATPFCQTIIGDSIPPTLICQHIFVAELVAFFWLAHTFSYALPGISTSLNHCNLLRNPEDFIFRCRFVVVNNPNLFAKFDSELSKGTMDGFIEKLSAVIREHIWIPGLKNEDITTTLNEICTRFRSASASGSVARPVLNYRYRPRSLSPGKHRVVMNERKRLLIHHNAFLKNELDLLTSATRYILEKNPDGRVPDSLWSPYYIEAFLTALALSTGRTIESAIQISLSPDLSEYLSLDLFPGGNNEYYHLMWHLPRHQYPIALPKLLVAPLRTFRFASAGKIEDCLPYTVAPWKLRCYMWLSTMVSGTGGQIGRKIRDALARSSYKVSTNPALLNFITSSQTKTASNESLSCYINLSGKRTPETYGDAIRKIFGNYGAPKVLQKSYDWFLLNDQEHKIISGYFLESVDLAKQEGNFIDYHNAIARYYSMLLVVATGHRMSNNPFYFHWDVLSAENLAFLCDKNVVGSEARFVPLPEWVVREIDFYHQHLVALSEHLRPTNPILARTILQLAEGGDIRTIEYGVFVKECG